MVFLAVCSRTSIFAFVINVVTVFWRVAFYVINPLNKDIKYLYEDRLVSLLFVKEVSFVINNACISLGSFS